MVVGRYKVYFFPKYITIFIFWHPWVAAYGLRKLLNLGAELNSIPFVNEILVFCVGVPNQLHYLIHSLQVLYCAISIFSWNVMTYCGDVTFDFSSRFLNSAIYSSCWFYSYLVTVMGLAIPWSLTLLVVDVYSVFIRCLPRQPRIILLIIIGDLVLAFWIF